jgi:outer membrane lipoprotein carrier protein
MIRRLLLTLIAIASLASAASAADANAVLERFARDLKGLDGRFVQRVFDANGELTEETRGRVALSVPRQFRWEYEAPFPQLIVADGDHVWVYDPDLEQVQVRKQSHEEQQSPLTALIDPTELARQFDVQAADATDGMDWVQLTPREPETAQIASARLGFVDGSLSRMEMSDTLGQRTDIRFDGWRRNPDFSADTFRFDPPAGVDVVGEMAESAEVFPVAD